MKRLDDLKRGDEAMLVLACPSRGEPFAKRVIVTSAGPKFFHAGGFKFSRDGGRNEYGDMLRTSDEYDAIVRETEALAKLCIAHIEVRTSNRRICPIKLLAFIESGAADREDT